MTNVELLIRDLPDPEAARHFLDQFGGQNPSQAKKLLGKDALLSDVLTLVSFSPLLAATLLQNPEYISWLDRERLIAGVRTKEQLLESLARFSLTNSQLESQTVFARFRRRELMRIFLSDIRRLSTIAVVTEDISNLADAILESALAMARQELDNRYGQPLEIDERGRSRRAEFCIVSLGKLGSRELNYASDIDLLFLYSAEGNTSGAGSRGSVTNREYFVKLSETIAGLVGRQGGEGAAYRVDLRLRPHGRVGPLALSVSDAARYYSIEAAAWERQVLIRSRASAGDGKLYRDFFDSVVETVFSTQISVVAALAGVRASKQRIDLEKINSPGFDVKLGRGGIREIEFIAQALQLAYGGADKWLRAPHTLISLARLADRKLIRESELTELYGAYEFLRHLEHILQMENGLQTHLVPRDENRRKLIANRLGCTSLGDFERSLERHTSNTGRIFARVFGNEAASDDRADDALKQSETANAASAHLNVSARYPIEEFAKLSLRYRELLLAKADALGTIDSFSPAGKVELTSRLSNSVNASVGFRSRLLALRRGWSIEFARIVALDLSGSISITQAKTAQAALAEASMAAALEITRIELEFRHSVELDKLHLAVLALGKLGGGSLDYDSDLDLLLIYDDSTPCPIGCTHTEFYSRAVEIFVNVLSGVTREGSLYRVDLRLRPYGKNGPNVLSASAIADYLQRSAAIWELLAYVKIRPASGHVQLGTEVENELREIIHHRALQVNPYDLARETRRIRFELEKQKSGRIGVRDIDIKFGPGGLLDVYFVIRYLQLRYNVRENPADRSSGTMLKTLRDRGSLRREDFESLHTGYEFVSAVDHNLRLIVGRTTRLPIANAPAMNTIARRMNFDRPENLIEALTLHRLNIRSAFENVLGR